MRKVILDIPGKFDLSIWYLVSIEDNTRKCFLHANTNDSKNLKSLHLPLPEGTWYISSVEKERVTIIKGYNDRYNLIDKTKNYK